ncbi:MAG: hypothetical protein QM582_03690 [Micropruina sp.]|uniref:hypothetical protein n=1 Tax=Micropruina sp. TaxID=2737536 RepID=UPI0039E70FE9
MTRISEPRDRRHGRRLRALAQATLAASVAVLVGLSGAGATYALLSSTTNASGATLTAGTLGLQLNGASSASLGNFAASPNTPVAKAFSVRNTGDAPASLDAEIEATSTPQITAYTRIRITPVANASACATGLAGTPAVLDGYAATLGGGTLAPGAVRWYCFEIALAANTPGTLSGQGLGFTMTVNATQKAN